MGVDVHKVRALRGLPAVSFLPWLFRRLLRWQALCTERRLDENCLLYASAFVSQLVSNPLPIRLRRISLRGLRLTPRRFSNARTSDSSQRGLRICIRSA